ncbi:MAG: DUF1249 domain-containing protein [Congregibacter sp.]
MEKARYKVDLRTLHALCESNYARLLRLFPSYESTNSTRFSVANARISIEVLERSRYTTLFRLQSFGLSDAGDAAKALWLEPLYLDARAYHDAGMLEVVGFQDRGRTEGRYSYPNPAMHQQDEKQQQNSFLADWLAHCLRNGECEIPDLLNTGKEPA